MTQPLKVLVVDDAPELMTLISTLFTREGCHVEGAQSAEEALTKFATATDTGAPFDFVSLDIRMPRIDGYTLARRLRESGYQGPMVAFTANASLSGKRRSQEAGIDAYFSKTTLNSELIRALKDRFLAPRRSAMEE